jgi:enoyl-CoA hydratase
MTEPSNATTLPSVEARLSVTLSQGLGVQATVHGDWAELVLSGAERANAINLAMWEQLGAACRELHDDSRVRVVVLRGAGEWALSAGADIGEFPERRCSPETARSYNDVLSAGLSALLALPVPVIAMIDGYAVGGGCEIAAACDIRVAADTSKLGLPLARLGVMQGPVEHDVVERLVGPGRLTWLVLSGRLLSADEARQIGLVDEVSPRDDLPMRAATLVVEVLNASRPAVLAAKALAQDRDADVGAEHFGAVYGGPELRARVSAFLAEHAPVASSSGQKPTARVP